MAAKKKSKGAKPSDTAKIALPLGGKSYTFTRGLCLFLGLFSLLNVVACLANTGNNLNIWWIDLSLLTLSVNGDSFHLGFLLELFAGAFMVFWAIKPDCFILRRILTCLLIAFLAVFALSNAISYWITLSSGELYRASPIPLSLVIAIVLMGMALRVGWSNPKHGPRLFGGIRMLCGAVVLALIFPLFQTAFFGTTDYRRDADAAVVFGARVYQDGTLSVALRERMDTAVELYKSGCISKLIVSGGIESGDVDEAQAMYDYALANGVPADNLLIDRYGDSTQESVNNTIKLMKAYDIETLIATSSFYHMPRIKMLFNLENVDVLTVPTIGDITGNGTLNAIWREIPAWWFYWFKGSF